MAASSISKPNNNKPSKPPSSIQKNVEGEGKINKLLREKKKKLMSEESLTPINLQFRDLLEMEDRFSNKETNESLKVLEIKEKNGKVSYLCEEGQTIKWITSESLTETKLKQLVKFYEQQTLSEHNLKHDHLCSGPVFIRHE